MSKTTISSKWSESTPNDVIDEIERRLRDEEWSSHAGDRCRVALLHIDAYRKQGCMTKNPMCRMGSI